MYSSVFSLIGESGCNIKHSEISLIFFVAKFFSYWVMNDVKLVIHRFVISVSFVAAF